MKLGYIYIYIYIYIPVTVMEELTIYFVQVFVLFGCRISSTAPFFS